jgi:hypothetical protein
MKNNYVTELQLPFEIDLSPAHRIIAGYKNVNQYYIFPYNRSDIDKNLLKFIDDMGCFISHQEMFYTPAHQKLPIHVDNEDFSNMAKLNWIIGAKGSDMVWWKPKDPNKKNKFTTPIGTRYLLYTEQMVDEEYRFPVGKSTFINAGIPHSIDNHTDDGRWCLSHVIGLKSGRQNIQMDQVHAVFKDYIKE